jgi:hypothetical protein
MNSLDVSASSLIAESFQGSTGKTSADGGLL